MVTRQLSQPWRKLREMMPHQGTVYGVSAAEVVGWRKHSQRQQHQDHQRHPGMRV